MVSSRPAGHGGGREPLNGQGVHVALAAAFVARAAEVGTAPPAAYPDGNPLASIVNPAFTGRFSGHPIRVTNHELRIPPETPFTRFLEQLSADHWEKLAAAASFQPGTLALLCGVKMRLLERFFQRRFGETPMVWMRKLRCRQVAALIAEGWVLKSAGPKLGFASASHLCHEFKKAYGVSPRHFAREVLGRQVAALTHGRRFWAIICCCSTAFASQHSLHYGAGMAG